MTSGESRKAMVRVAGLESWRAYEEMLTAHERAKAKGISDPTLQARFVVSRGLRREILAECTGRKPEHLEFVEDEASKPRLVDDEGWDFNISHAGDYVAVAAARGAVGLDLEKLREVREIAALVERYFHPDEAAAWRALDEGLQREAFFVLWSARESAMKCAGLGLAKGLKVTRVDPVIQQQDTARGSVAGTALELERREAPRGYVMVLAREG